MLTIWIGWPIATRPAAEHGSGQKTLFPPVRPGHCQQLHPFILMWWEENFTQRFSFHHYQRDAGTVWARATTIHACGKTSPSFYKHRKTGHKSQKVLAWPQPQAAVLLCVFSERHDVNCAIQMCQAWRGALCGLKLFWRLPHQKPLIRHLLFRSPCKLLEPRPQCK